ncbi:MAG: ABC transporter substrate-binding protein [Phycisphaerales bacterium]
MTLPRALILLALVLILAAPFLVRTTMERSRDPDDDLPGTADSLIIVTPHVPQIRSEFGLAFSRWHQAVHGSPVRIDWRAPGGTSEIRRQLETQIRAAVERGRPGTTYDIISPPTLSLPDRDNPGLHEAILRPGAVEADVFFGGGTYEHSAVKTGIVLKLRIDGREQLVRCRVTTPPRTRSGTLAAFDQSYLDNTFGENRVGVERLYDPDQYWFGTALSGFGIVYNRDVLQRQGLPEPASFADLGDPRYAGLLAMADPRQSGSVATLYDSILNKEGWERGWKILREMSANARYFAGSSTTPPTDVSQGEAAAGVSIDFYGRGQAQAILAPGQDPSTGRVGYIDPPGATYIDADPVSIVNGGRSPELARRFVEFCLSDEAQALWQFAPRTDPASADNPIGPRGEPMGPARERLRRMPVKRSMYAAHLAHFTDKTNPFDVAMNVKPRGWRDALGPLMGAFGIDTGHELRDAWEALNQARGNTAFPPERLAEMESLFYAMPVHPIRNDDGTTERLILSPDTFKRISGDCNRWRDPLKGTRAKIEYANFFRANYRRIIEIARRPSAPS